MHRYDFVVVGNAVAAMVTAIELARGGNTVVLWNPAPQWGAHFGGLDLDGRRFDIGMNLLEFTSFAVQSDQVEDYAAEIRSDVARFTGVIRDYIGGLVEFTQVDAPQSMFRGVFAPDIVIANRLELLDTLAPDLRERIAAELERCVAAFEQSPAWHASNKLRQAEQFAGADYRTVSLANHGTTLHHLLIEPACRRILGLASEEISALLHRVAWTPLYYPETLLQHLRGPRAAMPSTEFFYPRAGSFAAVVDALEQRVHQVAGLELRRAKLERIVQDGTGWEINGQCCATRLVWAQRPGQLTALLGGADDFAAYRKTSVHVAFATIDNTAFARRFSTLFVVDDDSPIYRITDQTWSAHQESPQAVCSIEISSIEASAWSLDDLTGLARKLGERLARLGVLRDADGLRLHAVRYFKDAIIAPTAANRSRALSGLQHLATAHPELETVGAAAPFGATSFNDNVVQGLRLGRIYQKK